MKIKLYRAAALRLLCIGITSAANAATSDLKTK
jgi:hypothetical protein